MYFKSHTRQFFVCAVLGASLLAGCSDDDADSELGLLTSDDLTLDITGFTSPGSPFGADTPLAAIAGIRFAEDGNCATNDQIVVGGQFVPSRGASRNTTAGGACTHAANAEGYGSFDVTFAGDSNAGVPTTTTNASYVASRSGRLELLASNSGLGLFGGGSGNRADLNAEDVLGRWALGVRGFSSADTIAPAGTPLFAVAEVEFNADGSCISTDQIVVGGQFVPARNVRRSTSSDGACSWRVRTDGYGEFDVTFAADPASGTPESTTNATFLKTADDELRILASNGTLDIFGQGQMGRRVSDPTALEGSWALHVQGFTAPGGPAAVGTPLAAIATVDFNSDGSCASEDQIVLNGRFIPARDQRRASVACSHSIGADGYGQFDVTFPADAGNGLPEATTEVSFVRLGNDRLLFIANNSRLGIFGGGEMNRVVESSIVGADWLLRIEGFSSDATLAPAGTPLFAIGDFVFNRDGSCVSRDQIVLGGQFVPDQITQRSTSAPGGACQFTETAGAFGQFDVTFPGSGNTPVSTTQVSYVQDGPNSFRLIATNATLGIFGSGRVRR